MFSFKNFCKKFSTRNLKNYTPYLMIAILLTAIIIPVWADSYTEVADFASFKAAATMGGKIKLTADIEDTESGPLELYNNLTIDLNGHMLSKKNIMTSASYDKNRYFIIVRNGTLTLENSQSETTLGNIYVSAMTDDGAPRAVGAITNEDGQHAKVIVNNGVKISSYLAASYEGLPTGPNCLRAETAYETDEYAYCTEQSAEAIVNAGATLSGGRGGVVAWGYNAKVTINGGNISARRWGVTVECGAKGEINGGTLYGTDRGGLCNDMGTTVINGGTFSGTGTSSSSGWAVGNYWDSDYYPGCTAPSKLTITGGTFENQLSINSNEHVTTTITGGKFKYNPTSYLTNEYMAQLADGYYVVSSREPVEIGTKAELEAFRDRVNAGETQLNAKLTADIDLAGSEDDQWTPIGNESNKYKGIFDGNGHTISELYINKQSESYKGLFGYVYGATIKNVTVSGNVTGYNYVGGICGEASGTTITNCVNVGSVKGYRYVGGICGYVSSGTLTITNCVNEGSVTGSSSYVGGICGGASGTVTITNCVNAGSVKGYYDVGGICGDAHDATITNCVNEGSVTGSSNSVGGICGDAYGSTTITNCVNEGSVTGSYVGGICGYASASDAKTITIDNCMNTATVSGSTKGGVVGYCSAEYACTVNITNCGYVTGNATKAVGYTGSGSSTISITETKEYAESAIPATAALITLESIMVSDNRAAATIYPENAYNKESVTYSLSSSDTSVATVNEGNVTGIAIGNATISGTVSGLLGNSSVETSKNITVTQNLGNANYKTTTDKQGEIPGQTITAKIKILFNGLEEMLVTGVQAVVNYATDVLELVSAQKSSIEGATTPVTDNAGEVGFGLVSTSGVEFTEGQYYDFGTMTFKIKQGATIGSLSNLYITDASYMVKDSEEHYTEKTATTTGTDIEIYQPVTNINITSQTGETTILVQNTLQLNAEVLPTTAQTKDIQWTSSDTSVATVDANGLITAQLISGKTATATITATALDGSGITATKQITVKRPKVVSMNFAQTAYELETDDTTKDLYAELSVAPALAIKPAANEITWNSSNPNFAVNASGIVSIITPTEDKQETTITATYTNENSETITTNCTVNSKPKKIKLNLTTKLEGRQNGGGTGTNIENVEVYLYDSANNSLWNGSGTTDTNGKINFEIDASLLEQGQTVKLWIKGEHYLAQLTTETVTIENDNEWNLTISEKLKAGDANGDNWINLTDFGILGNSFLKKKAASGYDARADFNADEWVNLTDFGLLGNNFLKKGANKPEAAITMFMTAAANRGTLNAAMSVLSPQTAKIAEETLANSTATDQETQEEEILAAIQTATNAPLNATSAAATTDSSTSSSTSGGCNAGYGALALMFAIPVIFRKKK